MKMMVHLELEKAMKPLRMASQVMGLNVDGVLGRFYTSLVLLIVAGLLYGSFINLSSGNEEILTKVDTVILWTQFVANGIFVFVVLGSSLVSSEQFKFPTKDLTQVDKVFSYRRLFGVRIANGHLRRLQILQILLSISIFILLGFMDIYKMIVRQFLPVFIHWLCCGYFIILSIVTDCLFVDYLAVMKQRFFQLNKLLAKILESNRTSFNIAMIYVEQRDREIVKKQNTEVSTSVEKLRILHHDLCCICTKPLCCYIIIVISIVISIKVNRSFGTQQLVNTAITLVIITGQLYEAYHFIIADNNNPAEIAAHKLMWMLFYIGRIFYISYACSRTSYEANFTASIIHEMPVQQLSNTMQYFSLQLIHENLKFNACGFFDIDFGLLCSVSN
ncbi:uncharacterized protein LOC125500049 [Athalia rosae]|uniref:uncharacterized protein LOC125500049 n=1 Tax=Athalia rosae TaxID=37344 RepID=UPI0020348889|nr:uncharacterized protein LOC125500049 [Athalia rosae]